MRNNHLQVETFTDSNYGGSVIDRRPPQDIVPLLEVTLLLGAVKSRLLLLDQVQKQNFVPWIKGCE